MKGIEPSYSAWKAAALPLSYTRKNQSHSHSSYLRIAFAPRLSPRQITTPPTNHSTGQTKESMGGVGFEPT